MKTLRSIAISLFLGYIALCVLMAIYQRDLLYKPDKKQFSPKAYGLPMDEVRFKASDGTSLAAWYAPARGKQQVVFVFFFGNGGHLGMRRTDMLGVMEQGYGVLALNYRGYGKSEGNPTEEGLYDDAHTAITWLKAKGTAEKNMMIYGESLGSGIAIEMATYFDFKGIILESPYTSIIEAGAYHYPYVPVSLLLKDRYDSIAKVSQVDEPVLIVHGTDDRIVPFAQGKALHSAFVTSRRTTPHTPTEMEILEGYGHNNHDMEWSIDRWSAFEKNI